MVEEKKKSGIFSVILVSVVALLAGGTAPWWWNEFFADPKSSTPERQKEEHPTPSTSDELKAQQERDRLEAKPSEIDLTGEWQGTDGLRYSIRQARNRITFEGVHPIDGRASVGEGRIVGEEIFISYRTIYGAVGDGTLEISSDGRRLSGKLTDHNRGSALTIMLTR